MAGKYIPLSAPPPTPRYLYLGGALMKRRAWLSLLPALLLLAAALVLSGSPQPAEAQTTPQILVSNLGQLSDGLGNDGSDHAQAFTTGDNAAGYTLTSVVIFFIEIASTQFLSNSEVTIRSDSGGSPGTVLATLTDPPSRIFSLERFTFTAPDAGLDLAPNTQYWLVLDITGDIPGNHRIGNVNSDAEDAGGAPGWSIHNQGHYRSRTSDGGWTSFAQSQSIAIKGVLKPASPVAPPPMAPPECATANADGTYTVPIDWALLPSTDVGYSSTFRLLFVSSTLHNPTSTDIATYNTLIQNRAKAGHRAISDSCGDLFKVVGSTSTVDARDNTATTGTGERIFWLNGVQLADNYADFYDGSWDSIQGRNESGTSGVGGTIFTGSNQDGTKHATYHLGSADGDVRYGELNILADNPISATQEGASNTGRYYGLSPVFRVESPPANADGSYTVHVNWPLTPSGIVDGGRFRLLFKTSQHRDATSSDINDYNHFVQNSARGGHTDIQDYASTFRVVGCTSAVNARTNTGTAPTGGEDIYWLNGNKIADDYADFYNGSWDTGGAIAEVRDEDGNTGSGDWPATGCNNDGSAHASERLGDNVVRIGASHEGGNDGVINETSGASSTERPLYALSPAFLVSADPAVSVGLPNPGGVTKRDGALVLSEGTGTGALNLTSTPAPTSALTVCLLVTETGGNRLATSAKGSLTVTIPANTLSVDYAINWTDNPDDDSDSVVTVTVVDPSDSSCSQTGYRASLIEPSGSVIVEDDEATPVTLTGTDLTMTESTASDTAVTTVTLGRQLVADEKIVVELDVRTTTGARLPGHATPDFATSVAGNGVTGDRLNTAGPLVIFTGNDTNTVQVATVTFTPVSGVTDGDTADETITVELDNTVLSSDSLGTNVGGRASAGTPNSQTLTLTDLGSTPPPTASLVFAPTPLTVTEGGAATYTVKLRTPPTADVTVTPSSDNPDVTFTPASLTFTTLNWNTEQAVTVSASADSDITDDTATLSHRASGGGYDSVTGNVPVTVTDTTTPSLVFVPTSLTVTEEGTATYTVALGMPPTADVTVTPMSDNDDVTFSPATLTLTTLNWNTAQTVTVSAAWDPDMANDMATLSHRASGGGYGSVTGNVSVTVTDTTVVVTPPTPVTVPADWQLIPSGINPGDRFRLLFKTSQTGDAASSDIATYNTRVQNSANDAHAHASIKPYRSSFRALGCTATVDAHTNTGTAKTGGVPIYWLNGPKLADDYADFYDGNWDDRDINNTRDERGMKPAAANWPWTGCEQDGDPHTDALGATNVRRGASHDASSNPISHESQANSGSHTLYGLSPVFVVDDGTGPRPIPPPTRFDLTTLSDTQNPGLVFRICPDGMTCDPNAPDDDPTWVPTLTPVMVMREGEVRSYQYKVIGIRPGMRPGGSGMQNNIPFTYPAEPWGNWSSVRVVTVHPEFEFSEAEADFDRLGCVTTSDHRANHAMGVYGLQYENRGVIHTAHLPLAGRDTNGNAVENDQWGGCRHYANHVPWSERDQWQTVTFYAGHDPDAFDHYSHIDHSTGTRGDFAEAYPLHFHQRRAGVAADRTPRVNIHIIDDDEWDQEIEFSGDGANWIGMQDGGLKEALPPVIQRNTDYSFQVRLRNPNVGDSTHADYDANFDQTFQLSALPTVGLQLWTDPAVGTGGPLASGPWRKWVTLRWGNDAGYMDPSTVVTFKLRAPECPPPVTETLDDGTTGTTYDRNCPVSTPEEIQLKLRAEARQLYQRTDSDLPTAGSPYTPRTDATRQARVESVYQELIGSCVGSCPPVVNELGSPPITNSEDPVITISGGPAITEGERAMFTIIADPPPANPITVIVNVTETGDWGASGTATLIVKDPTATFTISTVDDQLDEDDGSVTATVQAGAGYTVGTPNAASVDVADNDVTTPLVQAEDPLVKYADLIQTFYDRITDRATHGDGPSGGWNKRFLKAMGHPEYVNYPQAAVTVTQATDLYNHGGPGANTAWEGAAEAIQYKLDYDAGTVNPPPTPDPEITISGGGGITEGGTATFTISASPAPASPITVNVGVSQTGDFGATGAATVSVSGATTTYTIATSDDQVDEADGSVTATVQSGNGYTVGTASTATVAVADDDVPEITISGGSGITEGGSATFTISASPAPTNAITVNIGVSQSGSWGASGAATVSVNSATTTYTIATTNDDADEADGSVTATVQSGNGYTVGTASTATVAVSDDDVPAPVQEPPLVKYADLIARIKTDLQDPNYPNEAHDLKRVLKTLGVPEYADYNGNPVGVKEATNRRTKPRDNPHWEGIAEAIQYVLDY